MEKYLKQCECGCGKQVTKESNKYIRGHATRKNKIKPEIIELPPDVYEDIQGVGYAIGTGIDDEEFEPIGMYCNEPIVMELKDIKVILTKKQLIGDLFVCNKCHFFGYLFDYTGDCPRCQKK